MRLVLLAVFFSLAVALVAKEDFHSFAAKQKMDWDNAVRFCLAKESRLPSLDKIELSYKYQKKGVASVFGKKTYWTRDDVDLESAMSFDYASGRSYIDFKLRRLGVVCVK